MRLGLAEPSKIEAWEDTMEREISRIMRAPAWKGSSELAGAERAEGSTMSSRISLGLMMDDPKTNITDEIGMVANDCSRSAKTAEMEDRRQKFN
jgi:hypothetical protein